MSARFLVFDDLDRVAQGAADRFVALAQEAIAERGRFVVALAGGSTPERLYRILAQSELAWDKIFVFFSDDRFVPSRSRFSNAGLALRLLPLAAKTTFPVPAETALDASECAREYEATLVGVLGDAPRFDLILLGLGDDGHTASLFPGKPALHDGGWVTHSTPGVLPPPVDRVTFTLALLNAARNILFLVTGASKANKVAAWRAEEGTVDELPVLGVCPTQGDLTVLLDRAAAGE